MFAPALFVKARFDVAVKRLTQSAAMAGTVENIRLWRSRAEELRVLASTIEDASARLGVLNAARNYDAIAANAEARLTLDNVVRPRPTTQPA